MAEAAKDKKAAAKPAVDRTVEESVAETAAAGAPDGAEAPAEEHVPVTVDTKSAFQAALERKKQAGQARSAHLDGHGGVGGATSSHKATRTFRRKSGSA